MAEASMAEAGRRCTPVAPSTGDVASTEEYAIHPPLLAVGRFPANDGGFHHVVLHW